MLVDLSNPIHFVIYAAGLWLLAAAFAVSIGILVKRLIRR